MIDYLAQLTAGLTQLDLVMGANGALSVALIALYRDCRKERATARIDREKIWAHIRGRE